MKQRSLPSDTVVAAALKEGLNSTSNAMQSQPSPGLHSTTNSHTNAYSNANSNSNSNSNSNGRTPFQHSIGTVILPLPPPKKHPRAPTATRKKEIDVAEDKGKKQDNDKEPFIDKISKTEQEIQLSQVTPQQTQNQPERKPHIGTFLYDPFSLLPCFSSRIHSTFDVKVANEWLTRSNPRVKSRYLWGDKIYTDDSDPVAIFYHSELDRDPISGDLVLTLEVLPRLDIYQSSMRNSLLSREWSGSPHDGVSIRLMNVSHLARGQVIYQSVKAKKLRLDMYEFHRQKTRKTSYALPNIVFNNNGEPRFKYSVEKFRKPPAHPGTFKFDCLSDSDPKTSYSIGLLLEIQLTSKKFTLRTEEDVLLTETSNWSELNFHAHGIMYKDKLYPISSYIFFQ